MLSAEADNTDAHIHGHIIDKTTGEHLPYIFIMLKGTTIGVSTESTGHYMIRNVPEGTFTMEVSAVGYKTQTREVTIRKGRSYEVNFVLEEDLVQDKQHDCGSGTLFPTGSKGREQLSELRLPAGQDQWT